jgi:hypothetical protein
MHGQAYLAQSSLGQELGENERVKIICAKSNTIEPFVRTLMNPFVRTLTVN